MRNLPVVSGGSGPRFVRHIGMAAPLLLPNLDTDVISPINPSISGLSPGDALLNPSGTYPTDRKIRISFSIRSLIAMLRSCSLARTSARATRRSLRSPGS